MDARNKNFNVITSLDKYLNDNLVTVQGFTIDWEGGDSLDISKVNEWIQPRIMAGIPEYLHQTQGNRKGQNTHFLYNVNIFVKRGSTTQKNRLQQMRDIVASYYTIGQTISFYDYAGTSSVLDTMIIRDIETDMHIPPSAARIEEESTYYQYTYTPDIVLIQRW